MLIVAFPCAVNSQITETTITKNLFKGGPNNKVKTKFNNTTIELKKGALVSNVLRVVNNSKENINFTVDILLPYQWTSVLDMNTIYNVAVRDTIVIPILIVPSKSSSKSSEVIINTFLVDIDGQQIGDNSFVLKTKKKINWEITTKRGNRFYFKNNETTKQFDYTIKNNGNYKQDIYINHLFPQKNIILTDTIDSNNLLKKLSKTISLEVGESTSFHHIAKVINLDDRNKRKVSITNYNPKSTKRLRRNSVIINTSEPKSYGQNVFKRSSKIDFIKLPNEIDYQNFGQNLLPLTVDLTVQNLLSDNPFTSLFLRGLKQLSPNENLIYSSELNYTQSYFNNDLFDNLPWYVGYFNDRTSIEIGQVGSNVIGMSNQGKGIRASYRLNDSHKLGAFYVGTDGFISGGTSHSYGLSHRFRLSQSFNLSTKFGRNENFVTNNNTQIVSLQPQIRIGKRNNFNLLLAQSTYENSGSETTKGYLYNFGYSTQISSKLKSNINARYNDKNFNRGNFERINFSQRTTYILNKKWSSYLANSYQNIKPVNSTTSIFSGAKQQLFFNNLVFSKKLKKGSIQSGFYYDYKNIIQQETHARGISVSTSTYNYETNLISSLLVKAGYIKDLKQLDPKDEFAFEFTSLTRYKTWNFTTKYNLGTQSNTFQNNLVNKTPQLLRLSLQNQYTFPNKQLVLQSNVSYNYQNISKNNSFNFYPELFYFNKTGWRYSLRAAYTINSVDYSDYVSDITNNNLNNIGKSLNSNFNLGFNIRKEFGIPVPFLKKNASEVEFVSFMDVNGNGKKDPNEVTLGNVVVGLNNKEVITTNNGTAIMHKVPHKKYALNLLPLEKLDGWFANVKDSIYIDKDDKYYLPFVRGIKIYGDVILDLQKIAVTNNKPIDLSRIKISATKENQTVNTLTDKNGHFEFYLPNGKYTLSMDEGILSSNLRLSRNNIPIELKNGQEGIYVSFYILEKRRKVIIRDFTKKKK